GVEVRPRTRGQEHSRLIALQSLLRVEILASEAPSFFTFVREAKLRNAVCLRAMRRSSMKPPYLQPDDRRSRMSSSPFRSAAAAFAALALPTATLAQASVNAQLNPSVIKPQEMARVATVDERFQ